MNTYYFTRRGSLSHTVETDSVSGLQVGRPRPREELTWPQVEFPLRGVGWVGGISLFSPSRFSTAAMRPTHIMEGNLFYSKSADSNVNLIQKKPSQHHWD